MPSHKHEPGHTLTYTLNLTQNPPVTHSHIQTLMHIHTLIHSHQHTCSRSFTHIPRHLPQSSHVAPSAPCVSPPPSQSSNPNPSQPAPAPLFQAQRQWPWSLRLESAWQEWIPSPTLTTGPPLFPRTPGPSASTWACVDLGVQSQGRNQSCQTPCWLHWSFLRCLGPSWHGRRRR